MREKSEMTLREAAQQALEALEVAESWGTWHRGSEAITALRSALAEEQNYVNRWISVEENLPKEGQPVLALYDKSSFSIVYRKARENIEDGWVEPSSGHSFIPPTHWMPLPEHEHVHKMESNPTINKVETVEPVAWAIVGDGKFGKYELGNHFESEVQPNFKYWENRGYELIPLYPAPPKRKPLTESFLEELAEKHVTNCYFNTLTYARAIERAHGIGGEE